MTLRAFDILSTVKTDSLPNIGTVESSLVSTKNANYTVTDSDNIGTIIVTSAATITLPTASANTDRKLIIVNNSSGTVVVSAEGTDKINTNISSISIYNRYERLALQCDGTGWYTIGKLPSQIIQDFTTISSIGTSGQQEAGHIYDTDVLGTGTDIAYYKFANGAMTTDQEGTYTLTATGTPANANGITGSDFAVTFSGADDYFNGTLLDSVSTLSNGIGVNFWTKVDDGQPASSQFFFRKDNDTTGGSADWIYLVLNTNGTLEAFTRSNDVEDNVKSSTIFPNGATGWYMITLNWDTTNGLRLFINANLEAVNTSATSLMADGTADNFYIGSNNGANFLTGDIALFQVHDIIYTQKHLDLLYSVRYTMPSVFQSTNANITALVQKDGSTDYERLINWDGIEVHRDSSYIYRAGFTDGFGLGSTDKLKIFGRS